MPNIFRISFTLSDDFSLAANVGLGEVGMTLSKYDATAKSTTQMIKGALFDKKDCGDNDNNCELIEEKQGFLTDIIDHSAKKNGYDRTFYIHKNDQLFLLDTPENNELADELIALKNQGTLSEVTVFPKVFDKDFQP